MLSFAAIWIFFISIFSTTLATRYYCKIRTSTYANDEYCYYDEGIGSNIIISAPHGGNLKPRSIPDRDYGCYYNRECRWSHTCGAKSTKCQAKTSKDMYTKEISILLADELKKLTGKRPHLIVNLLHRSKMDANREYAQGTFYNTESEQAYNEYHYFVQTAKNSIKGNGLFLDIHGQTHKEGWVELGYLVTKTRLNTNTPVSKYSTIRALAKRSSSSFETVLRGSKSLGNFLQQLNVKTVPSPAYKRPGKGNYFIGGHNSKEYGSRYTGNVDGIQIEIPSKYRNSKNGPRFAKSLAKAIYNFMKRNKY